MQKLLVVANIYLERSHSNNHFNTSPSCTTHLEYLGTTLVLACLTWLRKELNLTAVNIFLSFVSRPGNTIAVDFKPSSGTEVASLQFYLIKTNATFYVSKLKLINIKILLEEVLEKRDAFKTVQTGFVEVGLHHPSSGDTIVLVLTI